MNLLMGLQVSRQKPALLICLIWETDLDNKKRKFLSLTAIPRYARASEGRRLLPYPPAEKAGLLFHKVRLDFISFENKKRALQ